MNNKKGNTGLKNLGNSCFLNSCLQILKKVYELTNILKHAIQNDIVDTIVLTEWVRLEKDLWADNTIISPNRFVSGVQFVSLKKKMHLFTGKSQNDMSEFLLFMIDCFHNSISRPVNITIKGIQLNDTDQKATICYKMIKEQYEKEYSEIMDVFYAIYLSEICTIDKLHILSIKPEPYFILDLPIPKVDKIVSLADCFDELTKGELLDGDNSWYNERIKKYQCVHKKLSFWSFPKILVITFKRFSPCGSKKLDKFVDFPLHNLDLSKYVTGYNAQKYVYDLFGVCNHFGGIDCGHYTSYTQNNNNEWIHYNDELCNQILNEDVVSKSAYCLFYRMRNNL